jgi:hypothetical protein
MMICELIEKFVVFVSPDRTPYDARAEPEARCPLARATCDDPSTSH